MEPLYFVQRLRIFVVTAWVVCKIGAASATVIDEPIVDKNSLGFT